LKKNISKIIAWMLVSVILSNCIYVSAFETDEPVTGSIPESVQSGSDFVNNQENNDIFVKDLDPLAPYYDETIPKATNLFVGYTNRLSTKPDNFINYGTIYTPLPQTPGLPSFEMPESPKGYTFSFDKIKDYTSPQIQGAISGRTGNTWSGKYFIGSEDHLIDGKPISDKHFYPKGSNAVAFDSNGDGTDELFEVTIYYGTAAFYSEWSSISPYWLGPHTSASVHNNSRLLITV
jgi:hypothetical protein